VSFLSFFIGFLRTSKRPFLHIACCQERLTRVLQIGQLDLERIVGFMQFRCKEQSLPDVGKERRTVSPKRLDTWPRPGASV
jgi:hypothetical protein